MLPQWWAVSRLIACAAVPHDMASTVTQASGVPDEHLAAAELMAVRAVHSPHGRGAEPQVR